MARNLMLLKSTKKHALKRIKQYKQGISFYSKFA